MNGHLLMAVEADGMASYLQGPYHSLHFRGDQSGRTLYRAFLAWTGRFNQIRELRSLSSYLTTLQAEAGMFPAIILQLTYWYRPDEIAVRLVWIC